MRLLRRDFFAGLYASNMLKPYFWTPLSCLILSAILATKLPTSPHKFYLLVSVAMFYEMIYCRPVTIFLEKKISIFLGKISFTLYLLHSIIIWSFALPIVTKLEKNGSLTSLKLFSINILTAFIAVVGATLFWRVDKLSVRILHNFAKQIVKIIDFFAEKLLSKS
jgi:peptidoglycan/LPS O-acetylase OafA/YrhL